MSEPTLTIAFSELQARIGSFMGWGRGANVYGDIPWTSTQQFEIDGITASGMRQFYYPPRLDGEAASYDWSFLRPNAMLNLPQNATIIQLPDDYGGSEGQITMTTSSTTATPWTIQWRNEASIREMYQISPSMTGPPMYACETPIKGTNVTQGQRFQLLVFPAADQAYTLNMNYYVNPDYLTGNLPYAYGGAEHAETLLESCLAVAEVRLDDSSTVHRMMFAERLQASVSMDRRKKPQKIGYNRDLSDAQNWDRSNMHYWAPAATYNGTPFS